MDAGISEAMAKATVLGLNRGAKAWGDGEGICVSLQA
jgi:hypothetical protein